MSGFLSGALESLKGMIGGADDAGAGAGGNLLSSAFQSAGGVQGIIAKAQAAGLGDKVQSWVGSGSNLPISADEVTRIFPPEQIESFAAQHGVPAGVATQILAHLLPHAVDGQTPDGTAASAPADGSGGGFDFAGLAQKFLGGK